MTSVFYFVSMVLRNVWERILNVKMSYLMVCKKKNEFVGGWIEKSVVCDHLLSSLGKPGDVNRLSSGWILLYHLHI